MRLGVRLGVDPGSVRIGVARSDPSGLLATPVETIRRRRGATDPRSRIAELAAEHEVIEVVVGMPTSLSGDTGPSGRAAREFARDLAGHLAPLPVRLVDERFSTVTAERALVERGVRGRVRRGVVDQQAAVVILQSALDSEKTSGRAPGEIVPGCS